jgi:hypothetical protein
MAAVDFRRRPVAGIGGTVEYLNFPSRGSKCSKLSADFESLDDVAVAYDELRHPSMAFPLSSSKTVSTR